MPAPRSLKLIWVVVAAFVTFFLISRVYTGEDQPYSLGKVELTQPTTETQLEPQHQIVQDAHQLQSADAFLPHFKAVLQLPGYTVQEAKRTCPLKHGEKVNFQWHEDSPGKAWISQDTPKAEIEFRRREWQSFIDSGMIPYSEVQKKFAGRGLVVVAGNQDTLKRVEVILRSLVRLRSSIALELHYWDDEMSEQDRKRLLNIYPTISFNDLSGTHNILHIKKDGAYINYQLKTAALVNSRFAEPILIDSDNVPVIDPTLLYETKTYREFGTVFWPDIARTRPQNPAWAIFNTPCRLDEYEQESGQLLVDKTRFWYHLQLASWLNNEQGAYYNEFLLGDKDMFRFAWHALKTQYGKPKRWLTSVGTVNDGFYCGHSFAQYHPDDDRIMFMHGGLVKTVDLEMMKWNREIGGYFRNYKRALSDMDPTVSVDVAIKFDGAAYKPDHGPEFHAAMCTDMFDVEPRSLDEILPGFEQTFEELGGYWMLDEVS
ncbi:hypothetical protein N8I77_005868 [Diaporthe amygdali]|uniref:Glycosyltransferase family 71 protein n=1 Tax=Phomopsis amygdali TaxID=1214568 RepID=A0AAD9SFC8_PHOAM|nr:hypothetical protein N8I77_005868 [Diaporthe amygdali]KAK2607167.1 hypothetical protein N8I77_005868 [Diaporthe amygdali]